MIPCVAFMQKHGHCLVLGLIIHHNHTTLPFCYIHRRYETISLMKSAAEQCHALGMKFKLYNTMRELSNRCRELWAMRALNETYVTCACMYACSMDFNE